MEFLHSITMYKCGVYNIPEKLHMITTFFTYYGTNLVFPVYGASKKKKKNWYLLPQKQVC